MSTFKTYCGATCLLTTRDAMAAISRAASCVRSSPASPVTIERDGEELTVHQIEELERSLTSGMSYEEVGAYEAHAL